MKKKLNQIKSTIIILITLTITLSSCENSPEIENDSKLIRRDGVTFHVVFLDWDEWGRAKKNCAGWGLCNFRSCTFCCTDNDTDEIVPCNPQNPTL
jgi:hypothetical protein